MRRAVSRTIRGVQGVLQLARLPVQQISWGQILEAVVNNL